MHTWSATFKWQDRVVEWNKEQDRAAIAALKEGIRNMVKVEVKAANLLKLRGLKRIEEMMHSDLTPKEALEFVKAGITMDRLARGEPDEIKEHKHSGELPAIDIHKLAKEIEEQEKNK